MRVAMAAALAVERLLNAGFPCVGVRFDVVGDEGAVGLGGGFVEAEFDDGDVAIGLFEIVVELGLGEGELGLMEVFEGGAHVDEHEVGFVAEEGEEGGLVACCRRRARRRGVRRGR